MREAFLKALAENENDNVTRLVYADWLEEQGEDEESDRQRQWQPAKDWLVQFCIVNNPDTRVGRDEGNNPDTDEVWERHIPYKELMEMAFESIAAGEDYYGFSCGDNQTMNNALNDNKKDFWKNFSIVMGVALPNDIENKSWFSCSC